MKYEITLLIALAIIMLAGFLVHTAYLRRIKDKLSKTSDAAFKMEDLKQSLKIPQGSNYNTLVISSWSLFFVALAFLYFLTPRVFPAWNFFDFPKVASSELGLLIFAIAIVLVTAVVSFIIPRGYGFYAFSRVLKNITIYGVPLLLLISIMSSSYLATIFPLTSDIAWNLGFVGLAAALIMLLAPIFSGFLEVIR